MTPSSRFDFGCASDDFTLVGGIGIWTFGEGGSCKVAVLEGMETEKDEFAKADHDAMMLRGIK